MALARTFGTASLLAALVLGVGCAPDRSGEQEPGDGSEGGTRFETALFTIVNYGDWAGYEEAYVALVDADVTCADLGYYGDLYWWNLELDVPWMQLRLIHGLDHDDWAQEFVSQLKWQNEGGSWTSDAAFFNGTVGLGGESFGDDDDVAIGRDVTGYLGSQTGQEEQLVELTTYSEDSVRGSLETEDGRWSFDATHCGTVYDSVDGDGEPVPPPGDEGPDDDE